MRIQLGFMIWSTNLNLVEQAETAYSEGNLDYVEIFYVPGSYAGTAEAWKNGRFPKIIHAPHSMSGLNFARKDKREENARLVQQSLQFADTLGVESVIFHPGSHGNISETINQIIAFRDDRMIIENKPHDGLDGSICIGSTYDEMEKILEQTKLRFCLDFGHGTASAKFHGEDPVLFNLNLLKLNPAIYHLTDGDISSTLDSHFPYGSGSFPLSEFFRMVPDNSMVTDESQRKNPESIQEYFVDRMWVLKNV